MGTSTPFLSEKKGFFEKSLKKTPPPPKQADQVTPQESPNRLTKRL
jgi:hypothetical protein